MAYGKAPTYGKDLPANLGTAEVLRAIYDKLNSSSGEVIIEKLDTIISLTGDVNNNIQVNTEAIRKNTDAIKDISINIDVHSKDLQDITKAIEKQIEAIKDVSFNVEVNIETENISDQLVQLNKTIESGFEKTVDAIDDIEPCPHPVPPVPPCPPPHPHPHPHDCNPHHINEDRIIEYYPEKGCPECEKQHKQIQRKCYRPEMFLTGTWTDIQNYTLDEFYEYWKHNYGSIQCYYDNFDDWMRNTYGRYYYLDENDFGFWDG